MDDAWFNEVRANLKKLEAEKAKRYSAGINHELHLHPDIVHSRFWHRSDALVPSHMFDWQMPRYPVQYVRYLKRESDATLVVLAERAYVRESRGENTLFENQKTLTARIILLNREDLLPVMP